MDDLSQTLTGILSDPASVERLKSMAQSLLGGGEPNTAPDAPAAQTGLAGLAAGLSPDDLSTMTKVMGLLRSAPGEDQRTRLLVALRPYVPAPRQERIDRAVKLLQLVSVLPALTAAGIF